MKTPREILLQRHKAMEPQLDFVRRNTLASLKRPGLGHWWSEFLFSLRWHLAGLSAVWIAVLILNLDSGPGSSVVMARQNIPPAREIMAALLENRREVLELTAAPATSEPAALPPRRSEIQSAIEIV
jgi:hypothetical protein